MSDVRDLAGAVAIVGLAGRFPGAPDLDRFWDNLRSGRESIARLADDEVDLSEVGPEALTDPSFVKAASILDGVELFDPEFFGFTQREAEITDPQHRLFLECAWEALEGSGHDPARFAGAIGVFGGAGTSAYARLNLLPNRALVRTVGGLQISIGNDKDHLATRVSYKLGLRGPSLTVQTACSTSLVAVHLACQSLVLRECDLALAGGVSVSVPQRAGYYYTPDGIASPDGRCRPFDAAARGTVFGDGVGVVALRRLGDALDAGDTVWAIVRGSAINNDGAAKVGYTAPAVDGQAAVIAEALAVAGVDPASVGYVEAHGTATPLGDPIEVAALTEAFAAAGGGPGTCALGSVKGNLGHLDTAAGVAGLIKTVLALHHRELPPSLHYRQANPEIDFTAGPFYVNTGLAPWPAGARPRRAGVSSFGIGGTNAHAVLEEAPPEAEAAAADRPLQLLAVSARSPAARDRAAARLGEHLRLHPGHGLADAAYTLLAGRRAFRHRGFVVAGDRTEAAVALAPGEGGRLLVGESPEHPPAVAFLLPGQGSQHPGMARGLYAAEPAFRDEVDRCAELLRPHLGRDLRPLLLADPGDVEAAAELERTALAQPAIFTVDYALARLWNGWGIAPAALLGHSLGELVAACLAGVFRLDAALELVATRGRLMQGLPAGAMLAVPLAESDLAGRLAAGVELAVVNGPALSVVAGPAAAIAAFADRLAAEGIAARRLHTSHAFHSAAMEPVLEPFARAVAAAGPRPPRVPYLSNLTGRPVGAEEATDPGYWAAQLRRPARFADALGHLLADHVVALEVGPGQALTALARSHPAGAGRAVVPSLPRAGDGGSDHAAVLTAWGRLWLAGVETDPEGLFRGERRRRVPLPTYPFERRRCWVDPPRPAGTAVAAAVNSAAVAAGEAAAGPPPTAVAESLGARPPLPAPFVAPRDELEREAVEIWQQLLGVGPLGADDDFFELGGHSLLATRLVDLVRRRLGVELPMRALFAAPTPARLAREVRERRGLGEARTEVKLPALASDPAGTHLPFPLTDVQQAYWIGRGGAFELGNVATHLYLEVESDGLDLPRFTAAWRRMIERHATLRIVIEPTGEQRVLADPPPFTIPLRDLTALPAADREAALAGLRESMSHQVRPADRWPLFEVRASLLPGGRVRVHLSYDFLLGDAWSWQVLFRDLAHLYRRPGEPPPPLEVTFRDYVLALGALRESAAFTADLDYWRGRLAELPPGPELPLAKGPGEVARPRFRRRGGSLPAAAWERIKARAARAAVTPSGVLLAAFADVLALWSADPRFTLNLTLFNRLPLHPQVGEILGDFTSLTLLEVDVAAADDFAARARRLQEQLWRDLEHRLVSGVQVMRELARARGVAAMPMPVVFTSTLHLDGGGGEGAAVIADGEDLVYAISQTPQVWLDHQVGESAGALSFNWDAVEELFPPGLLDRMFTAYRRRLERLAEGETGWSEGWRATVAALVGADDLAGRRSANATAAPLPGGLLHQPLLARAAARPDDPAVLTPERTLTYGELERRSARLAHRLRRRGAGPGRLVAVVMEKGWEQALAVVAVLRAGAAYLPIDAALPRERRWLLLARGEVELALTQPALAAALEWPSGVEVIAIAPAEEGDPATGADDGSLPAPVGADELAYVIFTSGSTGEPKGVAIDHRGALNTIVDVNRRFAVGPEDRVLALSSLSFDLSVWDLFGTWAAGGGVVLPEPEAARDPEHWAALMERHRVTVWNSVPALLQILVESLTARGARLPPGLRLALLSGDWIPIALPNRLRELGSGVEVVSLGGATEASIWSILYPIGAVDPAWRSIPYGRPMANQAFHVLDHALAPRPEWVRGELYIGGTGLARGYWRDPERTAESFLTHPETGERLYRTGDLGRYLPGGDLEFLGRRDSQVKIHGYRVELGEIEAALADCPGVESAVAAAPGDPRAGRRLVVYAVPAAGGGEGSDLGERVRDHLRRRLPEYMVPAAVVALAALPLTANGKVDRRALPPPEGVTATTAFSPPAGALEERLAELFASTLGVEQVGRHDSFFALGGDSLLATRAVYRLREEFSIGLSLGGFFAASTVAELAAVIEEVILSEVEALPDEAMRAELEEAR